MLPQKGKKMIGECVVCFRWDGGFEVEGGVWYCYACGHLAPENTYEYALKNALALSQEINDDSHHH